MGAMKTKIALALSALALSGAVAAPAQADTASVVIGGYTFSVATDPVVDLSSYGKADDPASYGKADETDAAPDSYGKA